MNEPPMNADEHRSVFENIGVYRRLPLLFLQIQAAEQMPFNSP